MADEALRALERRMRARQDPAEEDEVVRLLVVRLRAGRLDRARVEIAATIGHGPALDALDGWPPTARAAQARWRASLDEAARAPLLRLPFLSLLGAARRLEAFGRSLELRLRHERVRLLRAWLDAPGPESARELVVGDDEGAEDFMRNAPPSPRQRLLEAFDDRFLRLRLSIVCPLDEARLLSPALRELPRLHPDAGSGYRPGLAGEVQAAREAILRWALGEVSAPNQAPGRP